MVRLALGCGLSGNAGTVRRVRAAIGQSLPSRSASMETMQPMAAVTSIFLDYRLT